MFCWTSHWPEAVPGTIVNKDFPTQVTWPKALKIKAQNFALVITHGQFG